MKKGVRITLWILALILLLQVAVMVVLQSPRVQTTLGKYVIGKMQDKMDADITFASASVRPFDAIVLEDLLVKDRAPVVAHMDTLLYVKHLSARFSVMGLLTGEYIYVNRAKLDGGCFHLVIEPNPDNPDKPLTNLQRIFRLQTPENTETHWGDLLRARAVEINGVHFRMENLPGDERYAQLGIVPGEGVIDWNHLNVVLSHALVNGLRMQDDILSCSAEHLTIRELETGLTLENLSAKRIRVGKGNIHLEDFLGQLSGNSYLDISRLDIFGKLDIYEDFVNRVRLDINLREGTCVDMKTVSHFAPNLDKMGFRGRIRGRMLGTVSDFTLSDMVIEGLSENVLIKASGRMNGLPDIYQTLLDFQVEPFTFGLADLASFVHEWAPEADLSSFKSLAPGERFSLSGHVKGLLNDMDFVGEILSEIGSAKADIYMDNAIDPHKSIAIGGRLDTEDLHLGRILGIKELGELSMNTRLEGVLSRDGGLPQVQLDTLHIRELEALGYRYSGISASGYYKGRNMDIQLGSTDPNLQLKAHGEYHETSRKDGLMNVDVQLTHANLQALNLDKRGTSRVDNLNLQARFIRLDGHTLGSVIASGARLQNESGRHPVSDVILQVDQVDSLHQYTLESGLMDATYTGTRSAIDMVKDLKSLVMAEELSALSPEPVPEYSGASYSVSAQVKDIRELMAFVAPGVYVENGTRVDMDITPDGILNADVLSGRVAMNGEFIRDMSLHIDNELEALAGEISGSTIALSGVQLNNNHLSFFVDDNEVGLGYSFDNEDEDETRAELYLSSALGRGEKGLEVTACTLPSIIHYKGNEWNLSSGDIFYTQGRVRIDSLLAYKGDQQLLVMGGYSSNRADTLSFTMDQFDIALANTILGESIPPIAGKATGHAMILSAPDDTHGLLASVVCDSTHVSGKPMGQLWLSSEWEEAQKRFNMDLNTLLDDKTTLAANAYYLPSTRQLQLETQLDGFDMGYAQALLNTVFHEFYGNLSGKITLGGKLGDLHLSSQDLKLEGGRLTLDFTRVPYNVNGSLDLNDSGLHFKQVSVTDGEGGAGGVTGGLLFTLKDLENLRLDTHVTLRDMRAIALPHGVNPLLSGDVYASGKVDVTGPLNRINVVVDATTAKNGEFHLPIGSTVSGSSTQLLTFTQPEVIEEVDPYEEMMATREQAHTRSNDLRFSARIKAQPNLRAYIDIGEDNSLIASGTGTIELQSSTSQGFSLGGDYTIQDGSFHFSVLNLVTRKFSIQEGSTVRFNGEVMDTDLDVKGIYVTKASLSNLLPSYYDTDKSTSSSSRRTVNCGINISGKMRNPEVDFDIEVPDLNPVVQSQVESALNSEDKVQKQFVYLLIAGNFLPTDESGVTTDGTEMLYSNVSSIMSGQLNNIFQRLDIPLDLGLNYQTTQAGRDLFDVAVSTQLFNNRVVVNGTVGNKQMEGGATTNEVAGDLDIEIKLNRSGSLRLSLFSHSADQYTYYLDNSQRNGGGIAYQREFNSFRQFFRELFAGRKKREAMALEAATKPVQNVVLEIDANGKSTPAHDLR